MTKFIYKKKSIAIIIKVENRIGKLEWLAVAHISHFSHQCRDFLLLSATPTSNWMQRKEDERVKKEERENVCSSRLEKFSNKKKKLTKVYTTRTWKKKELERVLSCTATHQLRFLCHIHNAHTHATPHRKPELAIDGEQSSLNATLTVRTNAGQQLFS